MKLILISLLLGGCITYQPILYIDNRDRCMAIVRDTGEHIQLPRYQCEEPWYKRR